MIYVPSRMGQLNRRALLRQLQKLGVASRAHLAKSLGMSQPTAGKIVDELIGMDVVEVSPPFDVGNLTSFHGASILFELLCVVAAAKLGREAAAS